MNDPSSDCLLIQAIREAVGNRFARVEREARRRCPEGGRALTRAIREECSRLDELWSRNLKNAVGHTRAMRAITEILAEGILVEGSWSLQEHWQEILPLLLDKQRWQLNLSLAHFSLASCNWPDKANDPTASDSLTS